MPGRLRCAVIGTGAMGLEHLKSLALCYQAALVAIAENDPKRSKDAVDLLRIPRSYTDYHELLEQPDIDAVTIALPNHLHAAAAIAALQARKHVFLEKPMATDLKSAVKIVETAKKTRCMLMVGQGLRFNRHTQVAKEILERGQIGEVYHARCFHFRRAGIPRLGSWFTQKDLAGGGCMYDLGLPILDACLHLLGDFTAAAVTAQVYGKLGSLGVGNGERGKSEIGAPQTFNVEDYGTALVKLRAGKTVALEASWAAYHPPSSREYGIDLFGTKGGLSLYPARLIRDSGMGFETIELSTQRFPHPENPVHHFVSCVLQGRKPLVPLEESLKVQQILQAIYASASSGKESVIR